MLKILQKYTINKPNMVYAPLVFLNMFQGCGEGHSLGSVYCLYII